MTVPEEAMNIARRPVGRDLTGQVAIVTGSTLGIGLAAAEYLAGLGATIVLNGRDEVRLQAAAARVGSAGLVGTAIAGDVRSDAVRAELVAAGEDLGGTSILVSNVGGAQVGAKISDLTAERFHEMLDFNLVPPADLIRRVAPHMSERRYGRIITVSSLAGRALGRVGGPDYSAAKAGLLGLTRHAAAELGPHHITVNAVAPGLIRTTRATGMVGELPQGAEDRALRGTPLGRWGEPVEVAAAIAFLACPEASFITGATIDVNGGAWMT